MRSTNDATESSISFRQRVGKLNWHSLASCSLRSIVEKKNIGQLQKVLDNITFSEFNSDDVKSQSVESVSKLVNVMQYIIEYQLQCQDAQMKVLKLKSEEVKELKKEKMKLENERVSLHEDRRIYQRQLKLMRQSLTRAQDMIKYPENIQSMIFGAKARVVFDPLQLNTARESSPVAAANNVMSSPKSVMDEIYPVVDCVMRGQQESSEAVRSMVEEQRKELRKMMQLVLDQQAALATARKEVQYIPTHALSAPQTPVVPASTRTAEIQTSMEIKPAQSPKQKGYLQSILMDTADSAAQDERWAGIRTKEAELVRVESLLTHREKMLMEREKSLDEREFLLRNVIANPSPVEVETQTNTQPDVIQSLEIANKLVPRTLLKKRGLSHLALSFAFGKKVSKFSAFLRWRSAIEQMNREENLKLIDKLCEEVAELSRRENEMVATLSSERKKANEEFLKMQRRANDAEMEKRQAVMQAGEQLAEFLRIQEMTSTSNVSPALLQSTGTDVTRSMEHLFQNYRDSLSRQQQTSISVPTSVTSVGVGQQAQSPTRTKTVSSANMSEASISKLHDILPEDFLRISNEDTILSRTMARVHSAAQNDPMGISSVQESLAQEIMSRLLTSSSS